MLATRKTQRRKAPVATRSAEQGKRLLQYHEFKTLNGHTIRIEPWKRKKFLELVDRVSTLFAGVDVQEETSAVAQLLKRHDELEVIGRLTLDMDPDEFDAVFEYEEDFLELVAGLWRVCIGPLVGKNLAGVIAGGMPAMGTNSPSPNSTTTS